MTLIPPCHKRIHCVHYDPNDLLSVVTETHLYQYTHYTLSSQRPLTIKNPYFVDFPYVISQEGMITDNKSHYHDTTQKCKFYQNRCLVTEHRWMFFDSVFNILREIAFEKKVLYVAQQEDTFVFLLKS